MMAVMYFENMRCKIVSGVKMIYTITFNPALDVSGVVESLIPDEKNYVHNEVHTPGGNGINAGIIASRLGAEVKLGGFTGGPNGFAIKQLLDRQQVKHLFISISGNTRMNITVSNMETHNQTRLSFPGPDIAIDEWRKLIVLCERIKAQKDLVILGGSLPEGVSTSMVASLIRYFKKKGVFCMVDMPAAALKPILKSKPDFIKPNLTEFQELTNSQASSIEEVLREIKSLQKMVPLICVSSVEGGAILVNKNEAWFAGPPELSIHSTVGAGDSLVGAIASLLAKDPKTPLSELLRTGLAASCATLTEPGMILGSKKLIRSFIPKIKLKSLHEYPNDDARSKKIRIR
jgi:1-phosphofructokinase family hexose kinase